MSSLLRDLQSDLPPVMGDAPQLEQAFLNLMLNAAEAMPDGGTLTIKSRAIKSPRNSPQPTHVAVEFKDTGKGMSEELQKRAFTAVLSTTKAKGTGLGLAIVGRIIETHRGTLRIKSRIGRRHKHRQSRCPRNNFSRAKLDFPDIFRLQSRKFILRNIHCEIFPARYLLARIAPEFSGKFLGL